MSDKKDDKRILCQTIEDSVVVIPGSKVRLCDSCGMEVYITQESLDFIAEKGPVTIYCNRCFRKFCRDLKK